MEIWDVYDRNRNITGKTVERGSNSLLAGEYHLVIHVCIFNSKGKMLIQQRQPFKQGWPDMWDITVGGSSVAGETSYQAAEREVNEEIGYRLDLNGILPVITINGTDWFDDYYIVRGDIDTDSLKLQYEEVKQVKWASCEDILDMMDSGLFIPYHKGFINLLFEMQDKRGVLRE